MEFYYQIFVGTLDFVNAVLCCYQNEDRKLSVAVRMRTVSFVLLSE